MKTCTELDLQRTHVSKFVMFCGLIVFQCPSFALASISPKVLYEYAVKLSLILGRGMLELIDPVYVNLSNQEEHTSLCSVLIGVCLLLQ